MLSHAAPNSVSGTAGAQPKAAGMGPKAGPEQTWLAQGLASTGTSVCQDTEAGESLVVLETLRRKELWSQVMIRAVEAQAGGEREQHIIWK